MSVQFARVPGGRLPRDPVRAQALVLETAIRLLGAFDVDCEAVLGLGRAPPRTVVELAILVDQSHGEPLGEDGVRASGAERKGLLWEARSALDSLLGLHAPPARGRGDVPGADAVAPSPEDAVVAGLQLLAAFRAAHRGRTVFPGAASETAVWRYLPDRQRAFDELVALLGAAGGVDRIGPAGGTVCAPAGASTACVEVQPGGVETTTAVRVEGASLPPPLGPELVPGGPAIRLSPDGLTLRAPATLTLPLDEGQLRVAVARPEAARIFTWADDAGAWFEVPGSTVDVFAGTVSAPIEHFSFYRVAAERPDAIGIEELVQEQPLVVLQGQGVSLGGWASAFAVARPAFGDPALAWEIRRLEPFLDSTGVPRHSESVIVPAVCDAQLDGRKLGLAHVVLPGPIGPRQFLFFTVADASEDCFRLVRWDLDAQNQTCSAPVPFSVVYDSCPGTPDDALAAAGGLAYRSSAGDPGALSGGELYVVVKTAGSAVGNQVVRFALDEAGACASSPCAPVHVAGGDTPGLSCDQPGTATTCLLRIPTDVGIGTLALPGAGRDLLLIADAGNHRVRAMNLGGRLLGSSLTVAGVTLQPGELGTIAGNTTCPGDPARGIDCDAPFVCPPDVDADGNPLVVPNGSQVEGAALQTTLVWPYSVAAGRGTIYVSERCRHSVLAIDAAGGGLVRIRVRATRRAWVRSWATSPSAPRGRRCPTVCCRRERHSWACRAICGRPPAAPGSS